MTERTCPCGTSLTGWHPNRVRCPACAKAQTKALDRVNKGITLAADAVTCPVCSYQMNTITLGHIRKHGYVDAASFKAAFGLETLKAPSLCQRQSAFMTQQSPTKGRCRTSAEIDHISHSRTGKGLGVAGKYERTPEIRAKISSGVTAFMAAQPEGFCNKHFKSGWVTSEKADQKVWVRSSWERRVLWVLDQYPEVEEVQVEPFHTPYLFEGVRRNYTPDLLVTFVGNIQEVWEIKPEYLVADPKNVAKFNAIRKYLQGQGIGFRVVTLVTIEDMERLTLMSQALSCALS